MEHPVVRALRLLAVSMVFDAAVRAQVAVIEGHDSRRVPTVSAGGQVRQQYERFANEEWGAETPDDNGYWLQRCMFHLDARLSRQFRIYGELKSGLEVGRAGGPRPPDEDQLDLHQIFVDVAVGPAMARVGRQEFAFGSQRLVSVRERPNVRQAFDGANVLALHTHWRVNAFGARYVRTEKGVFDDSSARGRAIWGVYATWWLDRLRMTGVDVYYLGYRRTAATFDQGRGRELRHSWGARIWKVSGGLDYNVEAVTQTGRFGNSRIRAWTIASDTGYRLTLAGRPRLGLRADISSGDHDRHDDRLGTFNPLFPKGAYFGLIASAGPSNHLDVHPQVTANFRDDLVLTASWLFFWRQQLDDGVYGIPGNLLRSGVDARSRFVGHSPGIEAEWRVSQHVSLTGNASIFTAGPFIQESGPARPIRFVGAWTTYRF